MFSAVLAVVILQGSVFQSKYLRTYLDEVTNGGLSQPTEISGDTISVPDSNRTLSLDIASVGRTSTDSVRVDNESPVIKEKPMNRSGLLYYIIEVPFLTTDLLANETAKKRARHFYSKKSTLNEDVGEMWIYQGLKRMQLEEGHTNNPSEADIFFIVGLNNLRFSIHKWDFPRDKELDDILRPYIIYKDKPHVIATPRVRNRIGLNHIVSSLRRLGVMPYSLGYERNEMWQSVPPDRIITVPYVVKVTQSKEELQRVIQSVPRKQNFTFYAGDSRLTAKNFGGCNRAKLIQNIPKDRHDMYIRLFSGKSERISQKEYNEKMETSDYCLVMCGDTPTSRSLASTMVAGCIPVFIGSRWRGLCEPPCHPGWGWKETKGLSHLPFPDQLEWDTFPEISEMAFSNDPIGNLEAIFESQNQQRRHEVRKAMADVQLKWVYGWGDPVAPQEYGEAVPAIWETVTDFFVHNIEPSSTPRRAPINISSSEPVSSHPLTSSESTGNEKDDIIFFHVGKTGGSTARCLLRPGLRDPTCLGKDLSKLVGNETTMFVRRISKVAHVGSSRKTRFPNKATYKFALASIRNPVDRLVSWFNYERVVTRTGHEVFKCFSTFGDLISVTFLNETMKSNRTALSQQNCSRIARDCLDGTKPCDQHNMFNYEYYLGYWKKKRLSKNRPTLLSARNEYKWQDLDKIHMILGGKNLTLARKARTFSVRPSVRNSVHIPDGGRILLCKHICAEIDMYVRVLWASVNLNQEERQQSLAELNESCESRDVLELCKIEIAN